MISILLVEDNSTDAELLTEAFKDSCGDQVVLEVASDGEEALRILRSIEVKPHLVLLDLNLPRMSGLEVLRELRREADLALRALPILILTNSRSNQDVLKAYTYNCNAFIQKPLGYQGILDLVKQTGAFWFGCATLPGQDLTLPPPSSEP